MTTLPKGVIWQRLRQRVLDTIPLGAGIQYRAPLTLASWQASGTYTIAGATSKTLTIEVAPKEIGGVLFSDAAYHLDHALEHQASLMSELTGDHWSSPAWQVVTFYYWLYFIGMSLSRMIGHTVWFVTPDVAGQFSTLAPKNSPKITKGTYEVKCGPIINDSSRDLTLTKKSRRVHEQLWTTCFNLLNSIYEAVGPGNSSIEEERIYISLIQSAKILGNEWPSTLRNLVNYRPGFAYTAPRFKRTINNFKYLTHQSQTLKVVVDRLETNILILRRSPSLTENTNLAARILIDITIILSRITHELHDEVVDRRGIDQRWRSSKHRFLRQYCFLGNGSHWPF